MLDVEKENAGISSPAADNNGNEDVYSISGAYLGKLNSVKDTLPRDIYIVGSDKKVLGK